MKGAINLDTTKNFGEAPGNFKRLHRISEDCRVHICGGVFCLYCEASHTIGNKKICGEYIKKVNIQNKLRHDKCDGYTAKEILGYQGGKPYVSSARGTAKREENQRGSKGEAKTQTKIQNSPRRKREDP